MSEKKKKVKTQMKVLLLKVMVSIMMAAPVVAAERKADSDEGHPNRVVIEYGSTTNASLRPLADMMKHMEVLEKFQTMFSAFRLPVEVKLTTQDCNGISNAWY